MEQFDLVIIGGGPAGLTAAIYAARYWLRTAVIAEQPGGLVGEAGKIGNFPTHKEINGPQFAMSMIEQVRALGIEITNDKAGSIEKSGKGFVVRTENSGEFPAKKIVLAIGTKRRKLGLPNEQRLAGKGVCYCATCDAPLYKGKVAGVVGGGNAALNAALLVAEYAKKVFVFYRSPEFGRADPLLAKLVMENKKIEVLFNSNVKQIAGEDSLQKVFLDNGKEVELQGLFVEIGYEPDAGIAKAIGVETTPEGYIKVDRHQHTNVKGVFAAGDITESGLRQVIIAAAQGALAANGAFEEIKKGE
ncbi:MAG: FAD-dependent oxidoreductase [Candidatus Diapherotrites archaeon]|nr:FAD-dependent oxidoreductase [Candidatus Diapherotrites archaeon]